jgi:hypothetical protein
MRAALELADIFRAHGLALLPQDAGEHGPDQQEPSLAGRRRQRLLNQPKLAKLNLEKNETPHVGANGP